MVEQYGDKPAADPCNGKLEVHLLGRINVKLVGEAALFKCSHDLEPLD